MYQIIYILLQLAILHLNSATKYLNSSEIFTTFKGAQVVNTVNSSMETPLHIACMVNNARGVQVGQDQHQNLANNFFPKRVGVQIVAVVFRAALHDYMEKIF